MMSEEQVYQLITLSIVVVFFDYLERRRPGFPVDRKRDLSLNAVAILVVILAGEVCKRVAMRGFDAVDLGAALSRNPLPRLPGAAKIFLAIVLTDFSLYWVHRAMHRPLLWKTHAFHHSIAEIWWLAGSRTSVTHLFLFAVPQIFIGYYLLVLSAWEAGVAYSFAVAVNLWLHTNIWVNIGPLEWLFVTPNYHRVHHGARGLGGKNLGFVISVWDRMFGTYKDPRLLGKEFDIHAVPTDRKLLRMLAGL